MNNNSKILTETKERIDKFAVKVSTELSRPRRKFLRQMIYGIQAARDIKVSEISRGLCEKILATNTNKTATEVLEIYLTRWKCEESFRFLKNEYNLEDVRVRSYVAIRNVVAILHAVFYFISVEIGMRLRFSIVFKKLMEKAKRFFEVSIFKQYALADGLGHMLHETGWEDMCPETRKRDKQLTLNFRL